MEWSNSRELLAVAGAVNHDSRNFPVSIEYNNILKFYNERGVLLYSVNIPFVQVSSFHHRSSATLKEVIPGASIRDNLGT